MKPHIYKYGGLWYCRQAGNAWAIYGIGYTPKQAYDDLVNFGRKR